MESLDRPGPASVRKAVELPTQFLEVRFDTPAARQFDFSELRRCLLMATKQLFGGLGMGQVDPDILSWDAATATAILAVPAAAGTALRGALTLLSADSTGAPVRATVVRAAASLLSLASASDPLSAAFDP
jgi:RNase P/RNase MRP subunit POP5